MLHGRLAQCCKMAPLPTNTRAHTSTYTHAHFLCYLLSHTQLRHFLLGANTRQAHFNPPELRLYVARKHADTKLVVLWHISTKTCMWILQAADPDSFNLIKKTFTDMLWCDAVICLDRHCSAGLYEDYEDNWWRQRVRYGVDLQLLL